MKKILSFVGVSLIAASALAITPEKQAAISGLVNGLQKAPVQRELTGKRMTAEGKLNAKALKQSAKVSFDGKKLVPVAAEGVANEEGAATTTTARYYNPPINTFYSGATPDGVAFPYGMKTGDGEDDFVFMTIGLAGNKGYVPFVNMSTDATAYEWSYSYLGPNDDNYLPMTSEDKHLYVDIEGPFSTFTAPDLTAFNGDQKSVYENPYTLQFYCAPSFDVLGYYPSNNYTGFPTEGYADYYGASACPVNLSQYGYTFTAEYSIDRDPASVYAEYYNENGTFIAFDSAIVSEYGEDYDISNVKLSEYMSTLPQQTQAYLMDQVWVHARYTSTADFSLTFNVYPVDEEGTIHTDKLIGSGEVVVPANSVAGKTSMIVCDLYAVDEEGFPTSDPLVIDSEAAVTISGFNDPAVLTFTPTFNGGTQYDPEGNEDLSITDFFAPNASMVFTFDAVKKGSAEGTEPIEGFTAWPCVVFEYGDYDDTTKTEYPPYWSGTDFNIFYNVMFPFVCNIDGGTDLSVEVPTAGGDVEYPFDAMFYIGELVNAGVMTVESDADWFTVEAAQGVITENGKDYEVNQMNIHAEALPETEKGRSAVVKFRGYASDFDLVVKQGEVAGISNIAAANGPAEYFDLQGRKLNSVPSNGLYLERQGNKTVKRIAR